MKQVHESKLVAPDSIGWLRRPELDRVDQSEQSGLIERTKIEVWERPDGQLHEHRPETQGPLMLRVTTVTTIPDDFVPPEEAKHVGPA